MDRQRLPTIDFGNVSTLQFKRKRGSRLGPEGGCGQHLNIVGCRAWAARLDRVVHGALEDDVRLRVRPRHVSLGPTGAVVADELGHAILK